MKTFSHLGLSLVVAVAASTPGIGQSLRTQEKAKLHPSFHPIVAKAFPQSGLQAGGLEREPSGFSPNGLPLYDAIIYTGDPHAVRAAGIEVNSQYQGFATAQLTPEQMLKLAQMDEVRYLDPGSINYPLSDVSVQETGALLLHAGFINNTPYKGNGAIVLIYDTGIDWRHVDFRNPADTSQSRILYVWDQTLTRLIGESSPSGFNYGVEYTQAQIQNELDGSPAGFVRERDSNGHGTHVAGTAAGNGAALGGKFVGVAPEADIIIVKGGDGSFSEARIIDGLTYAQNKAAELGKPIVVNFSLGGQDGPHDGTSAYEQAVDQFSGNPGRAVAIAAGNDGGSNIHFSGTLAAGGNASMTLSVPSYTPTSGTSNDEFFFDVWFRGNPSTLTATVTSPTGITLNRTAGQIGVGPNNSDGTIQLDNYTSSINGNRNVSLFVSDQTANTPKSGTWTLALSNSTATVAFDAWLASRTVGSAQVTLTNGNNSKSVAMPATADGAITVGSHVTKWSWPTFDGRTFVYSGADRTGNISTFSGIGPTADGRQKPDIAAPGQGISAALSATVDTSGIQTRIQPGLRHWLIQGTSMATPHVAGVSALLLGAFPNLTSSQIKSLLTSTADSDVFTSFVPNVTWGYGKVDVLEAMVNAINSVATASRATLAYDLVSSNQIAPELTGATMLAVRFTPTASGRLAGFLLNLTTQNNTPILGNGPLRCEVYTNTAGSIAGIPGAKIGSTVSHPFARLSPATYNYVDMLAANVEVTAGTDYHIVLSVQNPSDRLLVRTDDGSFSRQRTSLFNGSQWLNFVDPAAGLSTALVNANLRLRAVVATVSGLTAVEQISELPASFELEQNFPNPFNPATTLRYRLPEKGRVRLIVFDVLGKEVATLVNAEQAAGVYQLQWQGKDERGVPVSSGVYFARLEIGERVAVKKMMLLK